MLDRPARRRELRRRAATGPTGSAVATEATFTPLPREPLDGGRDEVRVDADRGDRRDVRVARVGPDRLRAERRDLPGRVRALERRQVHQRIASSSAQTFASFLIERFASDGGALLDRDLVDRADARQPLLERQLEPARKYGRLRHAVESSSGASTVLSGRGGTDGQSQNALLDVHARELGAPDPAHQPSG